MALQSRCATYCTVLYCTVMHFTDPTLLTTVPVLLYYCTTLILHFLDVTELGDNAVEARYIFYFGMALQCVVWYAIAYNDCALHFF